MSKEMIYAILDQKSFIVGNISLILKPIKNKEKKGPQNLVNEPYTSPSGNTLIIQVYKDFVKVQSWVGRVWLMRSPEKRVTSPSPGFKNKGALASLKCHKFPLVIQWLQSLVRGKFLSMLKARCATSAPSALTIPDPAHLSPINFTFKKVSELKAGDYSFISGSGLKNKENGFHSPANVPAQKQMSSRTNILCEKLYKYLSVNDCLTAESHSPVIASALRADILPGYAGSNPNVEIPPPPSFSEVTKHYFIASLKITDLSSSVVDNQI